MKFEKEELEIISLALGDFRVKNAEYNLYEDEKIRDLIFKFIQIDFDEDEES